METYRNWIASRQRGANHKSKDVVETYAATRLKYDVEPLPDGASSLIWIGDRERATKFVYFFHGGGYVCSMLPGHLEWCLRAYVAAAAEHPGEEVAVAALQYTLCPPARYPTQLKQAAAGLAHILASGVRPRDLVMGGDSAGGNLTAQLVGHILHPHPQAEEVRLDEPLAGVFTVSPLVSTGTNSPSFVRNASIDMLSPATIRKCNENLLDGISVFDTEVSDGKGWAMCMDVDTESWFRGLDAVARAVYVTVGVQEVLMDQGVEFAEAIRRGNPGIDVRLEVMKNEAHDWILLEGESKTDGDAMKRMRAWATMAFWG